MCIWCTSPGNRQTSCKVWLTSAERRWCSNETKTRNPLKFAGVPHTRQPISAVSRRSPYCERPCGGYIAVYQFFFRLSTDALVAKIQPDKVVRWCADAKFLHPVYSANRVQHISDLHSEFTLRPHHVWKYGRHPICDR